VTYERTRSFAQSAAIALQRQKPELVISEMAKKSPAREDFHRLEPEHPHSERSDVGQ
jgi:DNA primase